MSKTRKIGFRIKKKCSETIGPTIIPVDLETGLDIDSVTDAKLECGVNIITKLTFTILVSDGDSYLVGDVEGIE